MRTLLDRLGEPEVVVASEVWWVASMGRIEGAANDLNEALECVMDVLRGARSRRHAGVRVVDIAQDLVARGGRETRLAPTVAFRGFEAALTYFRASMIRALVDEDLMTFTDVGELIGVSRQMVARLYRRAGGSGPPTKAGTRADPADMLCSRDRRERMRPLAGPHPGWSPSKRP
jgi:hypothetical protein